jgi:hypothetical protein
MSKKITLNVKDPKALQAFFSKFTSLGSTVLAVINKDSIEVSGFEDDRSTYKKSTISFKDVFEESEIDIDQPIFMSFFSKVSKIISYLNNYSESCKFIITYDELTTQSIVNLTSEWNDNRNNVLVVEHITLKDDNLSLKMGAPRLSMSKASFDMNETKLNGILAETEDTQIKCKFVLNKTIKSKIASLVKGKSSSDNLSDILSISISEDDKENLKVSMKNYFVYTFPVEEYFSDFEIFTDPKFLGSIDDEEYICQVYEKPNLNYTVFSSKESNTFSITTSKTSA